MHYERSKTKNNLLDVEEEDDNFKKQKKGAVSVSLAAPPIYLPSKPSSPLH